jgi:tRNA A-37 threonylcarbamoyl transferase component Bud32
MNDPDRTPNDRQPEPSTVPYLPPHPDAAEPVLSPHETPTASREEPPSSGEIVRGLIHEVLNPAPGEDQLAHEAAGQMHQDLYDLQPGCFLGLEGRFEIVRQIYNLPGRTAVYEGRDRKHNGNRIAIKIVFTSGNPRRLTELETEARRTACLDHLYAPVVYDHGVEPSRGFGWIAMEYLEGGTLREFIEKDKRLSWDQTRKVCTDLLEGLRNGYSQGLTHRDLKPSNVMRARKGSTWKIVDWGIAYPLPPATGVGLDHAISGTPWYMAPEAWEMPSRVSRQSDFYALGVMIIEMLTGKNPFYSLSEPELVRAKNVPNLAAYLPDDAGVPEEARRIVTRATAWDPDNRYRDVDEFLADLDPEKARRRRKRRTVLRLVLAGMAVLALTAAGFLFPWQSTPARFKGTFNLWLVERNDRRLEEARAVGGPNTLPLRVEDRVFLETKLDQGPEAHFYVLWIDSNGKPTRLYPEGWTADKLPPVDKKRSDLRWPEKGGSAKLAKSIDGLESVLCLVREQPLSQRDNAELQALLDVLTWRQRPWRMDEKIIVWWQNGLRVDERGAPETETIRIPDDPISQTEKLLLALKEKGLVQYSRAVCYSFAGR